MSLEIEIVGWLGNLFSINALTPILNKEEQLWVRLLRAKYGEIKLYGLVRTNDCSSTQNNLCDLLRDNP